jgi:predicted kinase
MEILIMCGPPGSGKSSYTQKLRDEGKQISVCSADLFFAKTGEYKFDVTKLGEAHKECFKEYLDKCYDWSVTGDICQFLEVGCQYLVVDNTNLNMQDITPYTMVAKAYDLPFKIVKFDIDPEVCASRNVHGVPRAKVIEMAERGKRLRFPKDWPVEIVS